jgi:UDP-N-acetylmuramyl pentapeptide phosphotransferase/UDP-N-acetylglucosamine-1-phosphate transferase
MTAFEVLLAGCAAAAGFVVATFARRKVLGRPSDRLMRANLRGRTVPAVLGIPVAAGGVAGLAAVAIVDRRGDNVALQEVGLAVVVVIVVMGLAGLVDDLRGDETARGFKGHVTAALRGRLTGGAVKIVAGAGAGLIAGFLIAPGRIAIEIALIVALTANLVNLLDRAPGRAAKVSCVIALPVFLVCRPSWGISSAGLWAALLACLPSDLRERGMLGDAGANALGGVLGLGLALTFAEAGRLIVLGFLLGLNAASEKTSFSGVIDRNPFLRWLDGLGRAG